MIRQHIPERLLGDKHFRWRGGDVSRIESLTDMVFAFALTLIVVSQEVPRTFDELRGVLWQVPAFAMAFAMLVMVWYFHYIFHRRFGFEDFRTFFLNVLLLFVILVYVYQLQFMSVVLQAMFSGERSVEIDGVQAALVRDDQMGALMIVYGLGFTLVFVLFTLMYLHAWRRRDVLELNDVERYLTRQGLVSHSLSSGVGLLSIGLAWFSDSSLGFALSGFAYFLMWPLHMWHGWRTGSTVERMAEA
jgi:hypothetical protein